MSLYSELQTLIDETSGPVFWLDAQLIDALNISELETLTWLHGFALASTTLAISSGADIIPWDTTTIMIPQYIIDTNNNKLFITDHAQLQDYQTNWMNMTPSQPKFVIRWDATYLRVFPKSNNTYTYTLYGVPWPSEITGSNIDPNYDLLVRKAIIHRAASRLLEFTQPEFSDVYESQAVEFEQRYARQLRNSGGNNTWRLAPAKGWQVGQLGGIKIANKYW